MVDCQHQHRRRLRLHDAAAPARHGDHRAVRGHRRVADAEPRQRSSPASRRPRRSRSVCAQRHRRRALASQAFRRTGHRARRQRADGALHARARRTAASKTASGWRSKASWRARASCSASRSGPPARAAGEVYALERRRPRVAAVVLPVGGGSRRGAAARGRGRPVVDARRSSNGRCGGCWPIAAPTCSASRFAAQWLRLQDLDKINPDVRVYPDFDEQLKTSMRRETELVLPPHRARGPAGARSVHGRLHVRRRAAGAGTTASPASSAPRFRKVAYPDARRRGLLGARQHPDADLARRSHLAGAARQVGDGSAARHAAAAAAAERARPRRDGRGGRRTPAHGARAHGAAPREPRRARRATA